MEGWFFATAALLLVSGIRKLVDPAPTAGALRAAGLPSQAPAVAALAALEVIVGGGNLIVTNSWLAWAQAGLYFGFGAFVVYALWRRSPITSCGCFGKPDTPPTILHVVINAAAALGAIVAALRSPGNIAEVVSSQPLGGVPYLGFVSIGVYCLYLLLAELPLLRSRR